MTDVAFDPIDYGFSWIDDWYEYDASAEKRARRDRDDFARRERKAGKTVKCSTNRSLRRMGGIGSGHPDIELIVPIFRALVIER